MGRKVAWFDPVEAEAARERAAAATFARLEDDLRRADWRIRPHLERIRDDLFTPGFTADEVLETCPGDCGAATVAFHAQVGASIWDYVARARLETGSRLLRATTLRVGDISNLLGYSDRMVFSDAFRRWLGLRPQAFRDRCRAAAAAAGPAPEERHSLGLLAEVRRGGLEPRRAARLLGFLEAVAPEAAGRSAPLAESGPEPLTEEGLARWLWRALEALPAGERRAWVRDVVRVGSPAFFHLLVEKIREQVRKDPQASLELAELALDHLEACETTLGAEVPDFQALAWAWLGNARRLTWDFAGADKAFARAREEWAAAGEDRRLEAELCDLEASLRQYQRRTGEALTLLDRSIALAEALGRPRVLVSSLLQRVAILAPRGEHRATIADLRRALGVLEELDEPGLTLVARCDLATAYVLAGRPRQALEELPEARALCAELGETVTRHQLDWTEGLARQALGELEDADQLLEEARVGLLELGAEGYAAVAALDQAILCLERGRHPEVPRLAAGALPVFERLGLGREAVAALELLRRAIVEDAVTLPIVQKARESLLRSLREPSAQRAAGA